MRGLLQRANAASDITADANLAVGVREQQLLGGDFAHQIVESVRPAVPHEIRDLDAVHREDERRRSAVSSKRAHPAGNLRQAGAGAAERLGNHRREQPPTLELVDRLAGEA